MSATIQRGLVLSFAPMLFLVTAAVIVFSRVHGIGPKLLDALWIFGFVVIPLTLSVFGWATVVWALETRLRKVVPRFLGIVGTLVVAAVGIILSSIGMLAVDWLLGQIVGGSQAFDMSSNGGKRLLAEMVRDGLPGILAFCMLGATVGGTWPYFGNLGKGGALLFAVCLLLLVAGRPLGWG